MEIRGEGGNLPSVSSQVRAEWGKYFANLFSSEARGQDEGFLSGDVYRKARKEMFKVHFQGN